MVFELRIGGVVLRAVIAKQLRIDDVLNGRCACTQRTALAKFALKGVVCVRNGGSIALTGVGKVFIRNPVETSFELMEVVVLVYKLGVGI